LLSRVLFRDQFVLVEDLQHRLDANAISVEEFADAVEAVIGDLTPGVAFAGFEFWGTAVRRWPRSGAGSGLGLSPKQNAHAQGTIRGLHQQIDVARRRAHRWISDALNTEQRSQICRLQADRLGLTPEDNGHGRIPLLDWLKRKQGLYGGREGQVAAALGLLRHEVRELHADARQRFVGMLNRDQARQLAEMEAACAAPADGDAGLKKED
jgi:hypothetical protein